MESPCVHCKNRKLFTKLAYLHLDVVGRDICQVGLKRNWLTDRSKWDGKCNIEKELKIPPADDVSAGQSEAQNILASLRRAKKIPTGILVLDKKSTDDKYNCKFCKNLISGIRYKSKIIKGFEEFSQHMLDSHQTVAVVHCGKSPTSEGEVIWAKATEEFLNAFNNSSSESDSALSLSQPLTLTPDTKKSQSDSALSLSQPLTLTPDTKKNQLNHNSRIKDSKSCLVVKKRKLERRPFAKKRICRKRLLKFLPSRNKDLLDKGCKPQQTFDQQTQTDFVIDVVANSCKDMSQITEIKAPHDSESDTESIIDIGCSGDEPCFSSRLFKDPVVIEADDVEANDVDEESFYNNPSIEVDDQNTVAVIPILIDEDSASESAYSQMLPIDLSSKSNDMAEVSDQWIQSSSPATTPGNQSSDLKNLEMCESDNASIRRESNIVNPVKETISEDVVESPNDPSVEGPIFNTVKANSDVMNGENDNSMSPSATILEETGDSLSLKQVLCVDDFVFNWETILSTHTSDPDNAICASNGEEKTSESPGDCPQVNVSSTETPPSNDEDVSTKVCDKNLSSLVQSSLSVTQTNAMPEEKQVPESSSQEINVHENQTTRTQITSPATGLNDIPDVATLCPETPDPPKPKRVYKRKAVLTKTRELPKRRCKSSTRDT